MSEMERAPAEEHGCPMAGFCAGMMGKPSSLLTLLVPGLVLMLGGILILLEPRLLLWLAASVPIAAGLTLVVLAGVFRRSGGRPRDTAHT